MAFLAPADAADRGKVGAGQTGGTVEHNEYEFGSPLDADERAVVAALSPSQVTAIDAAILQSVGTDWVKVAMVLAKQSKAHPGIPNDVPLEFIWQRLSRLVDQGELQLQGNLRRARFSEVRRP